MRLTLADEVLDPVLAGLKPGASVEQEIERRLTATAEVQGAAPFVVLSLADLDQVADRIGTGLPIRTRADLFRVLDQVAQLTLGNVRLVFTPTMLGQIEEKARKIGETPERFMARVAARVVTDVFMVEPAPEGVLYTPGFDPDQDLEDVEPEGIPGPHL